MPATKIHGSMVDGGSGSVSALKTTLAITNVDNTSDANKPVSTATQTALNAKANTASPVFSGAMTGTHSLQWGGSLVPAETDWDDVRTSGFYVASAMTNSPDGSGNWFYVLVHGSGNVSQTAWGLSSDTFYLRRYTGAWTAWQEIFHTGNVATSAQFRTGTSSTVPLVPSSVWAANAVLTDAATIAVDLAAGFDFGGATNGLLLLGGNRTLGAPSNIKTGQKGVLWFGATGGTRTLTLNAAWLLMDGVEAGPYSITTSQVLGLAYVTRGSVVYVTAILRRAA